MSGRWVPAAVLLLLAIGSGWLLRQLQTADEMQTGGPDHTPDFYMEEFTTTVMGESGKPERVLKAARMVHYADTDTRELTRPYMVLYHPERQPWHVESERGWVSANGDVVLLLGKVHIWRDDEQGVREMEIRTRDLRVLPESNYGETDKPVTIRAGRSESRRRGMRALRDPDRLALVAQAQTVDA
ncbi:MAG: LPS export ABC transporter periplasmic protein LptC, partial [Gammaproteobacteria bacterium]